MSMGLGQVTGHPASMLSRDNSRWHIDARSLTVLEAVFAVEMFPDVALRKQLGHDLQVSPRQIQVWFQNRRQRQKAAEAAETKAATKAPPCYHPLSTVDATNHRLVSEAPSVACVEVKSSPQVSNPLHSSSPNR